VNVSKTRKYEYAIQFYNTSTELHKGVQSCIKFFVVTLVYIRSIATEHKQ